MGKKAPKQAKAAARTPSTASGPKEPRQAKKKKGVPHDSLRDPLDRELALVGLRVKQITADGNCFFRALSDQIEGGEGQHSSLRAAVVNLMKERQEDFAPFVEDDQTFDAYIARMRKEGVWAGHMELQAAGLLLQANIHVYQAGQPCWAIVNFPQGSRELHLSYHDGEHYNSVRRADDGNTGPPQPIDNLAAAAAAAGAEGFKQIWSAADESVVAAGTGCDDKALIQQQLAAAGGDIDAAIEAIIEILANEDQPDDQQQQQQDGAVLEESPADAATDAVVGAEPIDREVACGIELQQQQQQQQEGAALEGSPANAADHDVVGAEPIIQEVACEIEIQQQQQQQEGEGLPSHAKELNNEATAATADDQGTDVVARECRSSAGASEHQVLGETSSQVESENCSSTAVEEQPACGTLSTMQDVGNDKGRQLASASLSTDSSHQQQHKQAATASKKGVRLKGKAGARSKGIKAAADEDTDKRPSRNKPCPCGSGRKHKSCCGMKSSGSAGSKAGAGTTDGLPLQLSTLHI